jgi:plasmid maintenance system antidote protein VapI
VLGISAETWMNLQIKFEIETLKQKENQNYKFVKASKKDIKRRNKVLL